MPTRFHRHGPHRPGSRALAIAAMMLLATGLADSRVAQAAAPAAAPTATTAAGVAAADAALRKLLDTAWQQELAADPLLANYLGDNRYNDRWTDMSASAIERRHQHDLDTLAALRAMPRAAL